MTASRIVRIIAGGVVAALFLLAAWWGLFRGETEGEARAESVAAVAVGPVEQGRIERKRVFTGTLAPRTEFIVAPKVAGRVEKITVDLGDVVSPGDVVATLENDEFIEAVSLAEAELAVTRAQRVEASSALEIARREMQRAETLRERGVTSESQYDEARTALLGAEARLEVAKAQMQRAEAAVATAGIRLGYTEISADWNGDSGQRVVAERFLDEGQTVSANEPILLIVELDPLTAVVAVTERDYPFLTVGQAATFTTDAYPREIFAGAISRLAPVFAETTRQARVELRVDNAGQRLKPGMFVRVSIVLEALENVTIVPEAAITQREGVTGVFVVEAGGASVRWVPVAVGVRETGRVQIVEPELSGRVVTLGQQLLDDGSPITIPASGERVLSPGR